MRAVIQRVRQASVVIDGTCRDSIGRGLLILVGIEAADREEDALWLAKKIIQLRVFDDPRGVMNLSVQEVRGEILVVSQFTLHAQVKKGNRPSYIRAARPEQAIPMYRYFLKTLEEMLGTPVGKGVFGAEMQVELINDGPVTLWVDTKSKE